MNQTIGTALVPAGEFGLLDHIAEAVHRHYIDGFADRCITESRHWETFARAAGDGTTVRYLQYSRAVAQQQLGRQDDAVVTARTLLTALDEHETAWRAKTLAIIAACNSRAGRPGRALNALAEADWLCTTLPHGTHGQRSATMAVALALRSLELFEQADDRLRDPELRTEPELHLLSTQERAVLSAACGVSLLLTGSTAANTQFRKTAELGVRLQHLADRLGDTTMAARGTVFEAYALMRLGHPDLAEARALAVRDRFEPRPDLLETQLDRIIHASAAVGRQQYDRARDLLEQVTRDSQEGNHNVWHSYAHAALAQVDVIRNGETTAGQLWQREATRALQRLWAEREARFEALRDREAVRRLTAETARMGRVMLEDPLTGVGNRLMLQATFESRSPPPAVVFIDIDKFKDVNDRFTHAVGDHVLSRLAHVLRAQCRAEDVVVRYGGDEFLVLTSAEDRRAEAIAHRIVRAVDAIDWSDLTEDLHVTVSVGVGYPLATGARVGDTGPGIISGTDDGSLGAVALAMANAALLDAKRAGRARVVTH